MMRLFLALFVFLGAATSALAQSEPLQPGDNLQISVWQDPKLDRKVVVGPDGMVSFPLAGHIKTTGMTPQDLEKALKDRLQKNYSEQLDITVSLADVNKDSEALTTPRFFVTGEVQKPGPYVLRPGTSVAQGLALAGGLGLYAAPQRIQVHRQVRGVDSIFVFDYNAFKAGTISTDNITLRTGDIIIVPERGLLE
jgi:polysaccharide biosynthesis/export protein